MSSKVDDCSFIPSVLFDQIMKCLPIVSVEAVIVRDGSVLLMRRNNVPAKGEWWLPGGRIHRGESLEQALCREIREETGLEIIDYKLMSVYSRVFPERHDITIEYLCTCKDGKISLNDEHSQCAFFSNPPENLHSYVLQAIQDCGIKYK